MTRRVIVCGDGTHLQNVFLIGFYMGALTVIRVEQFEVFLERILEVSIGSVRYSGINWA